MKPAEYKAGHYLEDTVQLHVPEYQRAYSWGDDRLVDLWRDVAHQYRARTGRRGPFKDHFMGAMILEDAGGSGTSGVTPVVVIDGQQRLLTLLVLLASIRDHMAYLAKTSVDPANELSTITPRHAGAVQRAYAKAQDQPALDAILRGECVTAIPEVHFDHGLVQAYRFFRYQLWRGRASVTDHALAYPPLPGRGRQAPPRGDYSPWGRAATSQRTALDLSALYTVITAGLRLLELMLEPTDEEAGVVFETMNAKSTPLRQFDLVRNSIFVRLPREKATFHSSTWQHVETALAAVTYRALRDKPEEQFLYEYVIATGEGAVSKDTMHRRWLTNVITDLGYSVTAKFEKAFLTKYVEPLANAAFLYPLSVGQGQSVVVQPSGSTVSLPQESYATISEIMAMSGGPPTPLVLRALIDWNAGHLTDSDLQDALLKVQSYLVRLVLAGENFSPLRASMMGIASHVSAPMTVASFETALATGDWKSDQDVMAAVETVNLQQWAS